MSSTSQQTESIHSVKNIPLQNIWALDMPGTRPMNRTMRGAPLAYEAPEGQMVDEIRAALKYDPQKHPVAGPCFAVQGTGMVALQNAHATLVKNEKPPTSFRAGEKITLVFYSYQFGSYVHLTEVADQGERIEMRYRFVSHRTEEVTAHLALIPVPTSQPGHNTIEIFPDPTDTRQNQSYSSWAKQIVCGPGRFDIQPK